MSRFSPLVRIEALPSGGPYAFLHLKREASIEDKLASRVLSGSDST